MTARKVWVCGKPKYHGLVVEKLHPEIIRIAGPERASDGRKFRSFLCKACRADFFERGDAYRHWAQFHSKPISRRLGEDGHCGAWLVAEEADASMCAQEARPAISARGPVYVCDECGSQWPTRVTARKHWVGKHVGRQRKAIAHGTDAGYHAHWRRGEKACDECRAAHYRAMQQRRQGWARRFGFYE